MTMVSPFLSSWSTDGLSSLSEKRDDKSDSESCSGFEGSYNIAKPLIISNRHISIPGFLQQSQETEDIFAKLLEDANKDSKNEDNSEDIFNSHVNRNVKADLNRKNIVEKALEKYDDPYAKFPVSKASGPPNTPKYIIGSPPKTPASVTWKYVTDEEKKAWSKAAMEGQRDFCKVLIKKGIDPNEYVSSMFSTNKKNGSSKKFYFECSTPKTNTFSECLSTPLVDKSNINTPISGIKILPCFSGGTATPKYLTPYHSDVSLNETFSPVRDLPPETKSTLLSGIVCYVDVRSEKEDMTKSVQAELLTLGAKIEKNFTKKVTHVVFKEGRNSTYLKAKKEGIPIVSVLWIEACKRVRGVADPSLHPPKILDKYENILPFQTIKKRRLKFYNPNSKIRKNILENYNDPTFVPTLNGKICIKKAATVCKDKVTVCVEDKENKDIRKYCSKKLQFDKCEKILDENKKLEEKNTGEQSCTDSSFDSMPDIKSAVLRRESAPAKFYLKKTILKEKNIEAYENNEDSILLLNESDNRIAESTKNDTKQEEEDILTCKVSVKRKKKLYDPSEVYVSLDQNELTQESVEQSAKKPRTKATAGRQLVKLALARKREKNRIKFDPDDDIGSSPTFVNDILADGTVNCKKQIECRSVVFTSVHRSDFSKYVEMVKKLGRFAVEKEVTKRTTHVICNGPRRTLNLVKGIARGCWILDIKWLEMSHINEKWLPEDSYIMSDDYPCVSDCCKERRGLKTSHVIDIFKDLGTIYVSKAANPPKKDLNQLLKICCATLSKSSKTATIKVGGYKPNPNPSGVWVSEKWIIDSIAQNSLKPFDSYIMSIDNEVKNSEGSQEQLIKY